jgi:4-hydroxyphenylpyruvate dioxygenase
MMEDPNTIRGIAFLELAGPDPEAIHRTLRALGFSRTHRHARLAIDLYEQGQIRVLLNRMPDGEAAAFVTAHGASVTSVGWWVASSHAAAASAEDRGAQPAAGDLWRSDGTAVPAVFGVGDTLIYFVDPRDTWLNLGFVPIDRREPVMSPVT